MVPHSAPQRQMQNMSLDDKPQGQPGAPDVIVGSDSQPIKPSVGVGNEHASPARTAVGAETPKAGGDSKWVRLLSVKIWRKSLFGSSY